jgi:transposase-like protein
MARRYRHPMFRGRHFDQEIILLCVRWYVTYKLSYRDLAAMMLERGMRTQESTIGAYCRVERCGDSCTRLGK